MTLVVFGTAQAAKEQPKYGGTYTLLAAATPTGGWDPYGGGSSAHSMHYEELGTANYTVDRNVLPLTAYYIPLEHAKGLLAESWEAPDPGTLIFHLRKGVRWHDKEPANGREMTAEDVAWSWNRFTGLGMGFTKPSPDMGASWVPLKSVTATDRYTLVFKYEPSLAILTALLTEGIGDHIVCRDAVEKFGDLSKWEHQVGTGPFILDEVVEGSSMTWVKNPNYWGVDERFPGKKYRLPYVDKVKALIIKDPATQMAAFRSGKIDEHGDFSGHVHLSAEHAKAIMRTNPKAQYKASAMYSWAIGMAMDDPKKPWMDIRVRQALQMAINLEEIADVHYSGFVKPIPYPQFGQPVLGFYTPYEKWPEEVKQYFRYNPEGAKKLLAEAGYPDGFKVKCLLCPAYSDRDLALIVASYFKDIGVEIEYQEVDAGVFWGNLFGKKLEEFTWDFAGAGGDPMVRVRRYEDPRGARMYRKWKDPQIEKLVDKAQATQDYEEYKAIFKELSDYITKTFYRTTLLPSLDFTMWHPWVKGYQGEKHVGVFNCGPIYAHAWIDPDLRK
jgi:peptide/nickel transport system substrate-binding protein